MDMDQYCNSGKRWTEDEVEQLKVLYIDKNEEIGEICKKHKRFIGGIVSRLQSEGIIPDETTPRGYQEFINSDEYNEMKKCQKEYKDQRYKKKDINNSSEKTNKNESVLITIDQGNYDLLVDNIDYLKEEIKGIKSALSEIKNMIKKLDIYEIGD